jgi:hypothetical protein
MTGENPFEAPAVPSAGSDRIAALAATLAERRLSYGELYAAALYLLGAKKELFLVALLVAVPILTGLEWLGTQQLAIQFIGVIGRSVVGLVLALYMAVAVTGVVRGRSVGAGTYLSECMSLFGAGFLASLLAGLHILVGLLLLIIPGLVLFVRRIFTVYAVAIDQMEGNDAIERSVTVIRGNGWYVTGIVVINALFGGVLAAGPIALREVAGVPYAVIIVGYAVVALVPFLANTVLTLSYLNLRAVQDRVQADDPPGE